VKLANYNVTVIIEDPSDPMTTFITEGGTKIAVTLEKVQREVILNDERMQHFIGNLLLRLETSVTDDPSAELAVRLAIEKEAREGKS
jgi:hypothetical protein